MAEMTTWADVADDLARAGYATVAIAPPAQNQAAVQAADFLEQQDFVDPDAPLRVRSRSGCRRCTGRGGHRAGHSGADRLVAADAGQKLPDLGGRPLRPMATAKDRGGLIVNQTQKLAGPLGESAQVVELPGDWAWDLRVHQCVEFHVARGAGVAGRAVTFQQVVCHR